MSNLTSYINENSSHLLMEWMKLVIVMREMNRPLFHFSMDGGSSWIGTINTTTGYYKTRRGGLTGKRH